MWAKKLRRKGGGRKLIMGFDLIQDLRNINYLRFYCGELRTGYHENYGKSQYNYMEDFEGFRA